VSTGGPSTGNVGLDRIGGGGGGNDRDRDRDRDKGDKGNKDRGGKKR
jgi:hypothetical protein